MNETIPRVSEQERYSAAAEKHKDATQAIEDRFSEVLEGIQDNNPETFVCTSGKEVACQNPWDTKIARAQAAVAAIEQVVAEVEGVNAHQELAAKKLLDMKDLERQLLTRQAEWAARKGELDLEVRAANDNTFAEPDEMQNAA